MKPVVAVVGPTASGKSDLAVDIALARNGEVINLDASQIYRGMDIGTAKMSIAERRGVTHHLLDVLDLHTASTVADFQVLARAAIDDIRSRDRLPVCVGGSGLYVRAVLENMEFPATDPAVRAQLEAELAATDAAALHDRLATLDPEAAAAIVPGDARRVVRALEVIALTGGPYIATLPEHSQREPDVRIGLRVPKEEQAARIRLRVQRMWDAGLVDEVRELELHGLREGVTACKSLGYQQVLAFLAGQCSEAEAFEATVHGTNRFARRQMQWFKRDAQIHWLAFDDADLTEKALTIVEESHD